MQTSENIKLRKYRDFIELIAKVEYQKFSSSHLVELSELINIGTHALYILFKNNNPEDFNNAYLSTAIKWAIRNEVRRKYKWYTLKHKNNTELKEDEISSEDAQINEVELRADVYKSILSIDQLQEAEVPTQIKSKDNTPEESVEILELKEEIIKSMKKIPARERELIESKFFKEKKLREISEEFNLSPSRISRIIQSGLDKIKKDLSKQGII